MKHKTKTRQAYESYSREFISLQYLITEIIKYNAYPVPKGAAPVS